LVARTKREPPLLPEVAAAMAVDVDTGAGPCADEDRSPDKRKLFLRLFLQNERKLYAYILTLLPNRADADDALQEASLALWDRFDAEAPPTDFLAWARRVAYYKVLDFYKKAARARVRLSQVFLERIAETVSEQSDVLQLDDRREALGACVEKLPARDRELLSCRFAEGATTQSTSERVGRSVEAVYKALAKLRQALFDCVQRTLAREGRS
jgi:RNA polymerase sigma-70 factor (ECF subfamily)